MTLQSLRDEPNTSREYETTYILRPDTSNEGVAEINARVKTVIEERGGAIVKVDNWGKRKLAYEVRKELKGIYLYWHYLAQPGVVEEIERNLRLVDTCIRYYTVKIDENVDTTARPSEFSEDDFAKAAETAADEEEIVSGYRGAPQDGEGAAAGDDDDDGDFKAADGEHAASASDDDDDDDDDDDADADDDDDDDDKSDDEWGDGKSGDDEKGQE